MLDPAKPSQSPSVSTVSPEPQIWPRCAMGAMVVLHLYRFILTIQDSR